MFENVDGRTDDGVTGILIAHLGAFGSGELKMKKLDWSEDFPHYNPMGAICCHGNQSSEPIWPKTQSTTQMMLQVKFEYDRPAGLRDIHV